MNDEKKHIKSLHILEHRFFLDVAVPMMDLSSIGSLLNTLKTIRLTAHSAVLRALAIRDKNRMAESKDAVPEAAQIAFSIYCRKSAVLPVPISAAPDESELATLIYRCIRRRNREAIEVIKRSAPVVLFKKMYTHRRDNNETLLDSAARVPGQRAIALVTWMMDNGFTHTAAITKAAAEANNYEMLRWTMSRRCFLHPSITHASVISGSMKMVQFIATYIKDHKKSLPKIRPYDTWHMYRCIADGQLAILMFLVEKQHLIVEACQKINASILISSAKVHPNGVKCLKYIFQLNPGFFSVHIQAVRADPDLGASFKNLEERKERKEIKDSKKPERSERGRGGYSGRARAASPVRSRGRGRGGRGGRGAPPSRGRGNSYNRFEALYEDE